VGERAVIVVFSDELDRACAAFTIANAAAASGMEVTMFFTCWGVNLVRRKDRRLPGDDLLSRLLNFLNRGGAERRPLSRFNFWGLGARMMRRRMKKVNIQSLPEMIADARSLGVKFVVCDNPMFLFGLKKEDLIGEVDEVVGAATFVDLAADSRLTLVL